jgi:N-acetyl-gamma-glutamyl-phosphate reductase
MKKRIAVLGASGYTGREVLRLLAHHPHMEVVAAMSARVGTEPEPPELPFDGPIEALDHERLAACDGVFLCTPHGAAAMHARAALERGCRVVDLSADFRLRSPAIHASTYGEDHGPDLRPKSVSLPLKPLLDRGLVDLSADVVADCKSGASGAGKTPQPRTVFGSVHENFLAYGVGTHRHQPEIWQTLGTDRVLFVPHLLPVFRGILATIWLRPAAGVDAAGIRDALVETYAREPFVRVYERGMPELNRVQLTNFCDIGVAEVHGRVVLVSVIDNLIKGAAGQALQNMNLVLGLPETEGLLP